MLAKTRKRKKETLSFLYMTCLKEGGATTVSRRVFKQFYTAEVFFLQKNGPEGMGI